MGKRVGLDAGKGDRAGCNIRQCWPFRRYNVLSLSLALVAGLLTCGHAWAVPSFARQTGLSCNVCHSNPPELTAFGRKFKLDGYVLTDMTARDKVGNSRDLLLSKYIPLSAMILLSDSAYQANQPQTQNGTAGFPQQLSLFLAGAFASKFGAMAQITYTHADDHFGMDNSDLRFADQTKLFGKDFRYGIDLNNNPTVEDVWNSTPAWGFPWISSSSAVGPIAAPIIAGGLAQDVAGLGAYGFWNQHLYSDITLYRSEHAGAPTPINGSGAPYNISIAAPYWRDAWQQTWGDNYLEVGTYGIYVSSYPGAISGPQDHYLDPSIDFQYERPFGPNLLDAHGTWIHQATTLTATHAAGGSANLHDSLNNFRLDSTYHLRGKYAFTGALFRTSGTTDALLYAPAPVTGSNNGSPQNSGYIAQVGYWPVQNIDINLSYTGYTRFNGAGNNYDGANRNASDNNTLYMALWLNF